MDRQLLPRVSAPEFARLALAEPEAILDPILSSKSLVLLYGPRGLGKTFVALGIAWAAASGSSFLGWRSARPHRVVYVDGEMAATDVRERLALFGPPPAALDLILADLTDGLMPDLAHYDGQSRLMASWGEPELIVLDNLASLAGWRSGDPDRWHELQNFLGILRKQGRAVVMVHHANKQGAQRGSSRREDLLDLVIALRRPTGGKPSDGARFEIHFEKARRLHGAALEPIEARLSADAPAGERWRWRPVHDEPLERLVALLHEGISVPQAAQRMGVSDATAYRIRQRARRLGRLPDESMEDDNDN
jgi:hypothetical protein